jgi:pimeloyl-ACP methyl ester carboxylesterase
VDVRVPEDGEKLLDSPLSVETTPLDPDLRSDVVLRTADGLALAGRWQTAQSPRATAVLVHGFSAGRDDKAVCALARDLVGEHLNVLTYDARGHGGSEGHSGVGSTEHLDVACAVERASEAGLPVVLIGVSMGAVAVVNFLDRHAGATALVVGAVLVSAPARWRMRISPVGVLAAALTRTRPGRFVAARRLRVRIAHRWRTGDPPEHVVKRIGLPLAVVHGRGDRLLAVVHGRQLHASAAGPSRLDLVEGMGHGIDDSCRKAALESVRWILDLGISVVLPSEIG